VLSLFARATKTTPTTSHALLDVGDLTGTKAIGIISNIQPKPDRQCQQVFAELLGWQPAREGIHFLDSSGASSLIPLPSKVSLSFLGVAVDQTSLEYYLDR
jgi:hypothetical protein